MKHRARGTRKSVWTCGVAILCLTLAGWAENGTTSTRVQATVQKLIEIESVVEGETLSEGEGESIEGEGEFDRIYSGGVGTEDDPYQVSSVADWNRLTVTPDDWDKHFVLTASIDFSGAELVPIGNGAINFNGVLNGAGHVVRNGVVSYPSSLSVGLFTYVGTEGVIQSLCAENMAVSGEYQVGGLVGRNSGLLMSCYTNGSVTATGDYGEAGGLVGLNSGKIRACYATGSVTGDLAGGGLVGDNDGEISACFSSSSVIGEAWVGGLVGKNNYGTVTNCYAKGPVRGSLDVGGLVGLNSNNGTVKACYATGKITGGYWVGGLVGLNGVTSGVVAESYWDSNTTGKTESAGGERRGTAEMTYPYSSNTYVGWDFKTTWAEDRNRSLNNGYPYLKDSPQTFETEGEIAEGESVENEGEQGEGEIIEGEPAGGQTGTTEEIAELLLDMFAHADTDDNRVLTFDEVLSVMPSLTREQFEALDIYDDSSLSEDELNALISDSGGCSGCNKIYKKLFVADWLLVGVSLLVLVASITLKQGT